jgi:hypothetical protein
MANRTTTPLPTLATPQDFPSIWEMLAELSRVPGPAGPIGPAGVPGPQGEPGTPGPVSMTVGTTATGAAGSNASVVNAGTSSAVVLNFTIPQGAVGAQGPAGSALVTSVSGKTGAVTLVKADVGLGSVDNTADTAKPVSTAQQTALNLKQNTAAKDTANGYAGLDGNTKLVAAQLPTAPLNPAFVALTDGATITWAAQTDRVTQNASVTLAGNRTLAFSGIAAGMNGTLIVKQDAAGARSLTLPGGSKVIGGGAGAIALSTAANAIDILSWIYDGTNYFWTLGKNYS